jgi:uncharacterized protein with NRDE domain
MCITFFWTPDGDAATAHLPWKLVMVFNRDEVFKRPTRPLQSWAEFGLPFVYAGVLGTVVVVANCSCHARAYWFRERHDAWS